jgi:hypothetical protein
MNTKARVVVALICIALGVGVAIKAVECRFGPPLSGEGLLNVVEVMPQTSPRSIRLRGHINDAISVIKDITTKTADGVMLIKLRYSYAGFPCATGSREFDVTFPIPQAVSEIRFGEAQIILWKRGRETNQ